MQKSLLLLSLIFIAPPVVLPSCLPQSRAQSGLPPKAQVDAIDQWAAVIRKGQTSKVVYQVAQLLKQTIAKVETRKDDRNDTFVMALKTMHQAANLRARGLKKRDQKSLEAAESIIRNVVALMHGKAVY